MAQNKSYTSFIVKYGTLYFETHLEANKLVEKLNNRETI